MRKILLALLALGVMISGCSVPTPGVNLSPDININALGSKSSMEAQGHGQQYVLKMSQIMYNRLYSVGGMWIWQKEFQEGDWIKWNIDSENMKDGTAELAYLKEIEEENQKWWRMSYYPRGDDNTIMEILIDYDDYSTRRLRSKIGDEKPKEVPVTENSYSIVRPQKLTKESIEGATEGEEEITVPAGTFQTRLMRFQTFRGEGEITVWANEQVPGGIVKYMMESGGDKTIYRLKDYGHDTTSKLNAF